jgi:hypothetical protein
MPRKRYPVTADEINEAVHALPDDERARWLQHVRAMIVNHAILTDEEYDTLFRRRVETNQYITFDTITDPYQYAADLLIALQSRNRRSAPKTVRRNLEICKRREENAKLWTLGRLAREYRMTKRAISKILKDPIKWRILATQLRSNDSPSVD